MLITLCEIVNGNSKLIDRREICMSDKFVRKMLLNCVRTKSFPKAASDELSSSFDWIEITTDWRSWHYYIALGNFYFNKRLWAVKRRVTSITLFEAAAICKIILRGWQQKRDKNYEGEVFEVTSRWENSRATTRGVNSAWC